MKSVRARVGAAGVLLCIILISYIATNPMETDRSEVKVSTTPKSAEKLPLEVEEIIKEEIAQDDPRVLNYLRKSVLIPPAIEPYNLIHNETGFNPSLGQAQVIDTLLKHKENGFFIECGAFNGESYSNSLWLERQRGWRGLLVEPDSDHYNKLEKKNRKAYIAHSCLAETPHPKNLTIIKNHYGTQILRDVESFDTNLHTEFVTCFPVYSFLAAINVSKVDYFSLDVEGSELAVLRNIPWDKVDISTFSIEYHASMHVLDVILDLMKTQGYVITHNVTHKVGFADDFIFIKENVLKRSGFEIPRVIENVRIDTVY